MKRCYIKIIIILIGLGAAWSCTKGDPEIENPKEVIIDLAINTYTAFVEDDPNATEAECVIRSAYVYIFNSEGILENKGATQVEVQNGSAANEGVLNRTWKVYEGGKNIYVLINPGIIEDASGTAIDFSTYSPANKDLLEAIRTGAAAFAGDFTGDRSDNGMLMTGSVNVNVTGPSQKVEVEVSRRYSRLDVRIMNNTLPDGVEMVINKVTFKNYSTQTMLWDAGELWNLSATDKTGRTESMNVTLNEPGSEPDPVFSGYMMPRPSSASSTDVPVVVIEATVNQIPKKYMVYLAVDNDESRPIAIKANTVYDLKVTLLLTEGPQISLDIKDWSLLNVDSPLHGSSIVASEIVLDNQASGQLSFTVKYVPENEQDRFVTLDWSGMPVEIVRFGDPAGRDKTTVKIDENGNGLVDIRRSFSAVPEISPFQGKLVIINGKVSKSVGVIYGIYIPDPYFRAYLKDKGFISEVNHGMCRILDDGGKVNNGVIDLTGAAYNAVADLTGIEYFNKIKTLKISNTSVSYMDLKENKALITLECSGAKIKSLDISNQSELTRLVCSNNDLSLLGLPLGGNTKLAYLDCSSSKLSGLNIENNPDLSDLNCSNNLISMLDFKGNTKLDSIICSGNKIIGPLDVSPSAGTLTYLNCSNNDGVSTSEKPSGISALTLGNATKLRTLLCAGNYLRVLDIGSCPALSSLNLMGNPIHSITGHTATNNPLLVSVNLADTRMFLDKAGFAKNLRGDRSSGYSITLSNNPTLTDAELNAFIEAVGKFYSLSIDSCMLLGTTEPTRIFKKDKLPTSSLSMQNTGIKKIVIEEMATASPPIFSLTVGGYSLESLVIEGKECIDGDTFTLPSQVKGLRAFSFRNNRMPPAGNEDRITNFVINDNPNLQSVTFWQIKMTSLELKGNAKLNSLRVHYCIGGSIPGEVGPNPNLNTSNYPSFFSGVATSYVNGNGITWR